MCACCIRIGPAKELTYVTRLPGTARHEINEPERDVGLPDHLPARAILGTGSE